jgi:anti-sigma regulatory factor (Ser/Thr protein kinase)
MTAHGATLHQRFLFDGRPEPVRALRSLVASFLRDRGVPEDVVRAVTLAFAEALDNAIEHGGSARGQLDVWLRYTRRFVVVSLMDPGSDRVPLGRPVAPDANAERGRGFQLMNRMMDSVRVRSYPHGGTRVSMLRYLHP